MSDETIRRGAAEFRRDVRAWLDRELKDIPPGDRDDVGVRRDWDRRMYDAGYAGLTWPEEFGGRGMTLLEEFIFHEESARAGAPEGYGRVGRILVGPLLLAHGSPQQRSRYIPRILTGEEIWCQGFSEPNAGSDLASVHTLATRDGDEFVLNGQKIWTSFAEGADSCLVLARTSTDGERYRNLGMFMVNMHQPGVSVAPIRRNSGDSTFSEVRFDGARVRADDLIGGETDGWRMAMAVLTDERGPIESLNRYLAMSRPLAVLRECCADATAASFSAIAARVELVRWHALRCLAGRIRGERDRNADAVAKLQWSHTWQDLARYGLDAACLEHEDYWLREYLESRAASIFSGSTQVQLNIVAERALGLPR